MTTELIERLRAGTCGGSHWMELHTEAADKLEAQAQYIRQLEDANTPELVTLRARVADYETRLTAVMPADFKDWHENSKAEWPEIAAWVIKNLRGHRDELSKDAERYQWIRRTQVELSLSNDTIAGLVRSVHDLDEAKGAK